MKEVNILTTIFILFFLFLLIFESGCVYNNREKYYNYEDFGKTIFITVLIFGILFGMLSFCGLIGIMSPKTDEDGNIDKNRLIILILSTITAFVIGAILIA